MRLQVDDRFAFGPSFTTFDQLVLLGIKSVQEKLLPEVEDVDKAKPIGTATLWGMKVPVFRYEEGPGGLLLVVAESAAGMRWMRADGVQLTGQAPLSRPKLDGIGVFLQKA